MCDKQCPIIDVLCEAIKPVDVVAAVHIQIEQLAAREHLDILALYIKKSYANVFEPIPHVDEMPDTVCFKITPKDASKVIMTC